MQFFFDLLGNFSIYLCLAMEKWLSICDTFIWETLNTLCILQQKPCHSIKNNRKIYVKYFKVAFYSSQINFENLVLHPSVEACLKRNISISFSIWCLFTLKSMIPWILKLTRPNLASLIKALKRPALVNVVLVKRIVSHHETIIQSGITCKEIPL